MATFYKYKEREDISKSMIDWSGLTKEISDNLIKEKNRRDNLKLELEQDQLQKIKAVEEFTRGLDPSMNQKMIEISDQYKDFLLMNHRLMKQGLVSVNDTKIKKQGAIDTFNAINDAATQYNQKISEFIDTGGSLNEYMALHAAEGLNLSNSELVIDDMGRGTFIKIDENGNEIAIPASTFSTLLNTKYDVFDAPAAFDKVTENLATYTIAQSGYRSVTDFRQNKELYNGWLNNSVKSILSGDKKIAEVASAFNIDITRDKEEAKRDGLILSEYKNGKLVFNVDYVKDKVENIVKNGIESRIDRIENQTPYRPSPSEIDREDGKRNKQKTFRLITGALQGNEQDLQSLANLYNFRKIYREDNGDIKIIDSQNRTKTIKSSGTITDTGANFASTLEGMSSSDVEEYRSTVTITDPVNIKFYENIKDVSYVKEAPEIVDLNTKENIGELNKSLTLDIRGNEIEKEDVVSKVKSFSRKLQEIAGPYDIKTSVNNNGDVIINGETVSKGINNPAGVLNVIEQKINQSSTEVDAFGNPI